MARRATHCALPQALPSSPCCLASTSSPRDGFAALKGKRVGLITNHTGRAANGDTTIDVLHKAPGVKLVALFSPEHGIRGILDDDVPSSKDEKTGLPIHSLYGDTRRPTEAMLAGLDTLVIDLQDIGTRFYTYMSTMGYVMEEAAKRNLEVVVLDRPNPINGWQIEGPAADPVHEAFIAYLPAMPIRHGMTIGELARLFNDEKKIGARLTVIPLAQWKRDYWFDQTGLRWVNPSPNMRNLKQATLYPGIGAIEYSNISVGRGTDQPFEQIGAPFIDGKALAAALNARAIPGVRFYPVAFTPASSKYAKEVCQGVFLVITNRNALQPVRMGLEIASTLWKLYGDKYQMENTDRLLGSTAGADARESRRGSRARGCRIYRSRSPLATPAREVPAVSVSRCPVSVSRVRVRYQVPGTRYQARYQARRHEARRHEGTKGTKGTKAAIA